MLRKELKGKLKKIGFSKLSGAPTNSLALTYLHWLKFQPILNEDQKIDLQQLKTTFKNSF